MTSQITWKHLMTGPEGNSSASGNIEIQGKQFYCFPRDQSVISYIAGNSLNLGGRRSSNSALLPLTS